MKESEGFVDEDEDEVYYEMKNIKPWEISLVDRPANRRPFLYFQRDDGGDTVDEKEKEQLRKLGIDVDVLMSLDESQLEDADKAIAELADKYPTPSGADSKKLVAVLKRIFALVKSALGYGYGQTKQSDVDEDTQQRDDSGKEDPDTNALPEEIRQRMEELDKRAKRLEDKEKALELERRQTRAKTTVEELIANRHIIPAQRDKLEPLLVALDDVVIVQQDEKGAEKQVNAGELLVAALRENTISEKHFAQIADTNADTEKRIDELVDEIKKTVDSAKGGDS